MHEPEALGLSKALSKKETTAAILLLDYTLPQVAKFNKTLQTETCQPYPALSMQPSIHWKMQLHQQQTGFLNFGKNE